MLTVGLVKTVSRIMTIDQALTIVLLFNLFCRADGVRGDSGSALRQELCRGVLTVGGLSNQGQFTVGWVDFVLFLNYMYLPVVFCSPRYSTLRRNANYFYFYKKYKIDPT